MSHIFISYNQEDADFAAVLMMELEKAGFDTWLDKQRLRAGADWSEEIDHGIRTASAVVLVVSPSSRASEYVTYEWSCAIGAGIRVVPLLRRETEIHPRLRRLQYLDFRGNVRPWSDLIRELQSIKQQSQINWKPPRDAPPHIQRAVIDLDSGNSDDRRGAIDAITESQHNIARPALQHALTSPFRDVRALAAIALAQKDDPAATTEIGLRALTEAFFQDFRGRPNSEEAERHRRVISRANEAFLRIGRASLDHLTRVAKSETDIDTRSYATDLLSEVGGKEAIPALLELIEDSDPFVMTSAVRQLGQLKVTQAIPGIMHLMIERAAKSYENHKSFVEEAVRALIDIGDKSIESQLVAATKHQVPTLRMCAAHLLGELFGAAAIPVLANLLSDTDTARYFYEQKYGLRYDSSITVAEVAAKTLDEIHTPDALELVLHYRREHPYRGFQGVTLTVDRRDSDD